MPVLVYRCAHCGREVLVRHAGPLTEAEIARRREEEMRPPARGRRGTMGFSERLRDDIWVGISESRELIPREALPTHCPACGRPSLAEARTLE
ncbi:MAG: hypothetical protein WEB13_08940 [Dehalococcoidia bacterium]